MQLLLGVWCLFGMWLVAMVGKSAIAFVFILVAMVWAGVFEAFRTAGQEVENDN